MLKRLILCCFFSVPVTGWATQVPVELFPESVKRGARVKQFSKLREELPPRDWVLLQETVQLIAPDKRGRFVERALLLMSPSMRHSRVLCLRFLALFPNGPWTRGRLRIIQKVIAGRSEGDCQHFAENMQSLPVAERFEILCAMHDHKVPCSLWVQFSIASSVRLFPEIKRRDMRPLLRTYFEGLGEGEAKRALESLRGVEPLERESFLRLVAASFDADTSANRSIFEKMLPPSRHIM